MRSIVPLAIEYPFWNDRCPEVLVRFGRPIEIEDGRDPISRANGPRDRTALEDELDALAIEVAWPRPGAFTTLLEGTAGVGGVYDVWRRMRACARRDDASTPSTRRVARPATAAGRLDPDSIPDGRNSTDDLALLDPALVSADAGAGAGRCVLRANLRVFRPPPADGASRRPPAVSVLIPARNEEAAIGASVAAALASRGVELEVLVLDDHSEDATAAIVARDGPARRSGPAGPRAASCRRAGAASSTPAGSWPTRRAIRCSSSSTPTCGSPPTPWRGWRRSSRNRAPTWPSGFPRQETVGLLEKLVIPLIHFILLGFLPIARMRRSPDPAFAAGCGQLFITRREAYDRAGGHAAIRGTLHDGLKLPAPIALAGLRTDLFDATDLAVCRMYRTAGAVWIGLAKNAGEGLAAPRLIVPMTVILLAARSCRSSCSSRTAPGFPWPVGPGGRLVVRWPWRLRIIPRWAAAIRFRQSRLGALLHPLGVLVLWRSSGTPSRGTWRGGRRPGRGGCTGRSTRSRSSRWESPTP